MNKELSSDLIILNTSVRGASCGRTLHQPHDSVAGDDGLRLRDQGAKDSVSEVMNELGAKRQV